MMLNHVQLTSLGLILNQGSEKTLALGGKEVWVTRAGMHKWKNMGRNEDAVFYREPARGGNPLVWRVSLSRLEKKRITAGGEVVASLKCWWKSLFCYCGGHVACEEPFAEPPFQGWMREPQATRVASPLAP